MAEAFYVLPNTTEFDKREDVETASENYDGPSRDPEEAEEFPSNHGVMELSRISPLYATIEEHNLPLRIG